MGIFQIFKSLFNKQIKNSKEEENEWKELKLKLFRLKKDLTVENINLMVKNSINTINYIVLSSRKLSKKDINKSSKGLPKLLFNLQNVETLKEQVQILSEGRGTGHFSSYPSSLKKLFKNILKHDCMKTFQWKAISIDKVPKNQKVEDSLLENKIKLDGKDKPVLESGNQKKEIHKLENVQRDKVTLSEDGEAKFVNKPVMKEFDKDKTTQQNIDDNQKNVNKEDSAPAPTSTISYDVGQSKDDEIDDEFKLINKPVMTEFDKNKKQQNIDDNQKNVNKEDSNPAPAPTDLDRILEILSDSKYAEDLKKIKITFDGVVKKSKKFEDLIYSISNILSKFNEYKKQKIDEILNNLKTSMKNLNDKENPLMTKMNKDEPESSYYIELNKLDKICHHGAQNKNDFYRILRWILKYILHPLPFELTFENITIHKGKCNLFNKENNTPDASDFIQLNNTQQCWFLNTIKELARNNLRIIKNIFRKYAPDFVYDSSKPMYLQLFKPSKMEQIIDDEYSISSLARPCYIKINPWNEEQYPMEKNANCKKGEINDKPSWFWLIEKGIAEILKSFKIDPDYFFTKKGTYATWGMLFLLGDNINYNQFTSKKTDNDQQLKEVLKNLSKAIGENKGIIVLKNAGHFVSVKSIKNSNKFEIEVIDSFKKDSNPEILKLKDYETLNFFILDI